MKISFLIVIFLIGFAVTFGQKKADVFADVPSDKRERLVERLEEFIGYYRESDLNKIYDLLGNQALAVYRDGMPRELFLKSDHVLKLKEFKPEEVSVFFEPKGDTKWLIIQGCGKYSRFGLDKKLRSTIEAYYQNGDWYFSEAGTPRPLHGEPEGCR